MVFGHRIAEGKAGGFLVLGEDVRHAERVAPDLGAIGGRPLSVERCNAPEQHRRARQGSKRRDR